MIVMRPNGEVVALVGGKNYNDSQFNRATQARRPAGSAFKPIVYLTALERGWSTQDMLIDEPITEGRYRPKNYGGKYAGEVTLEQALTYSLNTISYQLAKAVGPDAIINSARRMGIASDLEPSLSIALGSNGVALLEMATAYAVIANGGFSVKPYAITKITTSEGELIYERANDNPGMSRVFRASDIQNLTSMMNSVVRYGTGTGASFGVPIAGKTGTSDDSRDAMFMGFTRELVGTVWLGNDDNSPMKNVTGGSYPASIWREVMRQANGLYAPINTRNFEPAGGFEAMLQNLFSSSPDSSYSGDVQYQDQQGGYVEQPQQSIDAAREQRIKNLPEANRYND
jgi:penicillin-binding protein 1A